jgi:hypothetical protein
MLNLYDFEPLSKGGRMINERTTRRALIMIALAGLSIGLAGRFRET